MRRVLQARTLIPTASVALSLSAVAVAVTGVPNTWTPVHRMITGRFLHLAVLLNNGNVLVVGGSSTISTPEKTAEIYNPVSNVWSAAHDMSTARQGAAAVVLSSGKVLVVGGRLTSSPADDLNTGEVYDPVTNTWTAVANTMGSPRTGAIAVLLPNGKVLIAGGADASGVAVDTADLYDPVLNEFVSAASMHSARTAATATLLPSGKVLVAGGIDSTATFVTSGEVYDPTNNAWTPVSNPMSSPHTAARAVLLANGKAMIVAGDSVRSPHVISTSAVDLYDPATNRFSAGPSLSVAPGVFALTSLADGRVLEAGGEQVSASGSVPLADTEVYNPATNSWSSAGSLPTTEIGLTATLLENGQVLAAGGTSDGTNGSVQSELFTPSSKPSAPRAVSALAGEHSAMVSFAPPVSDGGLSVARYTIRASTGQSVTTPDGRTLATVSSLTNGRSVTFTVTAINALGAGAASAPSPAVIPGPPNLKLTGLKTNQKLKAFLKGVSFSVAPNKGASLQVTLLGSVNKATIAAAFNLTLASKKLAFSARTRKIDLTPSRKLVGRPRHASVRLVIVATDAVGLRSVTTRTIVVSR
jgi:Kelch motif/Galactose oxidase, central domain/Fibronectin type III domain